MAGADGFERRQADLQGCPALGGAGNDGDVPANAVGEMGDLQSVGIDAQARVRSRVVFPDQGYRLVDANVDHALGAPDFLPRGPLYARRQAPGHRPRKRVPVLQIHDDRRRVDRLVRDSREFRPIDGEDVAAGVDARDPTAQYDGGVVGEVA